MTEQEQQEILKIADIIEKSERTRGNKTDADLAYKQFDFDTIGRYGSKILNTAAALYNASYRPIDKPRETTTHSKNDTFISAFKKANDELLCKTCGHAVAWKTETGNYLYSSSAEGDERSGICYECLVEHCCSTNCFSCPLYHYPDCPHIALKKIYMEKPTLEHPKNAPSTTLHKNVKGKGE